MSCLLLKLLSLCVRACVVSVCEAVLYMCVCVWTLLFSAASKTSLNRKSLMLLLFSVIALGFLYEKSQTIFSQVL